MTTENYNNISIDRLIELNSKFSLKNIPQQEKDEFMRMLHLGNLINPKLYMDYVKGFNSDFVVTAGLLITNIFLIGYGLENRKFDFLNTGGNN